MSGKRCQGCGAGIDAVQRYCLNCGARVGEPRLDFRHYLVAGDAVAQPESAGPPAGSPPPQKPQRDFAPLAAAGGIAVLGLMLLVGVLIGRGGEEQAAAPTPQVVRVQGDGEGKEGAKGGEATGGASKPGGKKGSKGGKRKNTGNSGAPPPAAITADDSELEALQGKSPQEYSEAAAKLPDEIATEGKPPPEDDKKPGGGSAGVAIE